MCVPAGRVFIHPGSVNFDVGKFDSGWLVYTEMVATAKLYVRESSMVPVYALLLFGGGVNLTCLGYNVAEGTYYDMSIHHWNDIKAGKTSVFVAMAVGLSAKHV